MLSGKGRSIACELKPDRPADLVVVTASQASISSTCDPALTTSDTRYLTNLKPSSLRRGLQVFVAMHVPRRTRVGVPLALKASQPR